MRRCALQAGGTDPLPAQVPDPIMNKLTNLLRSGYELIVARGAVLQSPFLLGLRLYFFWQLFLTGKGKLENIGKVTEFFASLGIPLPTLNAYFIGSLECFGSLLLIIGLATRPLSLLIVISMTVAYLTADFEAVSNIFSDPDKFVKADPFPFLLTAIRDARGSCCQRSSGAEPWPPALRRRFRYGDRHRLRRQHTPHAAGLY